MRRLSLSSIKNIKTLESFKNPVYSLLYGGTACQWASGSMQGLVGTYLIYKLSDSGAVLGLMALVQALPMFFLSLFGGLIADRFQKKWVIIIGQAIQTSSVFLIVIMLQTGYMSAENPGSWWILLLTGAIQGTIAGLIQPSAQAILRDIVEEEKLMNAVSLANMGQNTFQLIGPAVAGFIVNDYGFTVAYIIIGAFQIAAIIFFVLMPALSKVNLSIKNPLKDIPEGLKYIYRERPLMWVLIFALVGSFLGMPITQLMPVFTEKVMNIGADGLGIMMSIGGLGSIAGSLIFASMRGRRRGAIFILSGVAISLSLIAFSFTREGFLPYALFALFGLVRTGKTTLEPVLIQTYAAAEFRGRAMSLLTMQMSFFQFGCFIGGLLTDWLGVQWTFIGMAASFLLISIFFWFKVPSLRHLD